MVQKLKNLERKKQLFLELLKNYFIIHSDNDVNQCRTKINKYDKECSTTFTITAISHDKNNSNPPVDDICYRQILLKVQAL